MHYLKFDISICITNCCGRVNPISKKSICITLDSCTDEKDLNAPEIINNLFFI